MRLLFPPARLAAAVLLFALAGCGNSRNEAYIEKPVDDLYNKAMDALVDERYSEAAKTFEQVESQHPYWAWATKSQMMGVYSLYENGNYDQAIIAADRFIQLHPGNRDVAYAYYLKAICYYMQITDVGRDQKTTELALKSLDDVPRLHAAGLGRGGSLDNVVLVSGNRVLNDGGLRYADEFVRHKLLDAFGDLEISRQKYEEAAGKVRTARRRLQALDAERQQRQRELALLRFEREELSEVAREQYVASRLKREQMKRVFDDIAAGMEIEEGRRLQAVSDDRFLARRRWTDEQKRLRDKQRMKAS